jgi:tetratricopeptide (TPR) repeat protein
VLTKADEELYTLKEYDRVIEVSQQLLERRPAVEPKFQRIGATLLANSLFERGRFTEAEQAYKKVQTYLPANDPDRKTIEERLAASIYKQAEEKQTAGDSSGAVADFLRIAGSAPNSKVRVNAEFDAASILIKNQQWERAAQVLESFRASYPDSELAPEVTRSLAVAYFETGRSGEAAAEFERIADRQTEPADLRRQALSQAASLYEKAQQPSGAARTYAKYVQQFPMPLDPAQNARQKLADMAQANNQTKTRGDWIAAIIAADKAAGTQRTDRSRFLAARATLETVQPQISTLNAIKLVAPLSKSIKTKRAALEKVLATYGQALDYGVAEVTTAATYGMAEQWRQLGSELLASERPKELKGEALEQYDVLLEEQAFPFEEKSIEIHESNAKRIGDGLYDEWVRRSFEVLAKLKPARYGKAEVSDDYATTLR